MSNWTMGIRGAQVSSVVRSLVLSRRINGVSRLSAQMALPVVAGGEVLPEQNDVITLTSPQGLVEFRGRVSSVSADGRNVQLSAGDGLAAVGDADVDGSYTSMEQEAITSDIVDGQMDAGYKLEVDSGLEAEDVATLASFTAKQINGLEALIRLHQMMPPGRRQHAFYHDPAGDKLRLETIGAAGSGRTLSLGAGLRSVPVWIDTSAEVVNRATATAGTSSATAQDTASQAAYGLRTMSINAPDFGAADLEGLATAIVKARKDSRLRLAVECRWKDIAPASGSPLNRTYLIADPSRCFPSDNARLSDGRTFTNASGTRACNNVVLASPVRPSWRVKFDFRSTDPAASAWAVLHNISYSTSVTVVPASSDGSGDWVTFTSDADIALKAGARFWVWTDGECQVRDLRLCYDDGQATIPLIAYEMRWPGSAVTATFDEASIAQLEVSADISQRVNILENYPAAGGDQPNVASDVVQHHLFTNPPSMNWSPANQWREHRSWVVILD